ncbi:MAG TPA: hypothetical protein VFB72_19940, partial [Verrucomicrobiae bacterium]|nr:hypothetical protein [Verrucomicrobiae bacterium]
MKSKLAGSIIRGMALGLAVLSFATVAKASPYASCITNFVVGGVTNVSFYLNEGGGAVTVVTYPSGTTNSLGVLPAGPASFALPGTDSSYTISVSKTGTGTPSQINSDTGWNNWAFLQTLRCIGVNPCAQYGDAFGRVYVGVTGQTTGNANAPAFRGWGIYALTPDTINNALYGGNNPTPAVYAQQSNTLTFTAIPTNGATFVMDAKTLTWTTNTVTNTATQVAIDTNGIANNATNLAAALNLNLTSHPGTVSVFVTSNVVTMIQFAQATSGASYFTYGSTAYGPFGSDFNTGNTGFGAGPYRITVDPVDGTVWVTDATDANANAYIFGRNFDSTNQLWTVTGRTAGEGVLEHGNVNDIAMRGSLATGNLQVWTADNDMLVPTYFNNTNISTLGNGGIGNFGAAQETVVNDANEIYRYDIGSGNGGNFPVTNTPVFAATLGLNGGFADTQVCSVAVGPNTNYIYAGFRRLNFSDGNLQVFNTVTGARVFDSLSGTPSAPTDAFAQDSSGTEGLYGLKVSPDGRFLATLFADGQVAIVNLTNGIPDPGSRFVIVNAPVGTICRQMSWDAADNMYIANNGSSFTTEWSLGLTTTCVTSNDITGTNGSFQVILPPANVTVANAGNASQNYGTPITGYINVNLGTSSNSGPVVVGFSISGTGTNAVNYNITPGTDANGVVLATNSGNTGTLTFPAGSFPGVGNWNSSIPITPTASPNIGPTLTVTVTLQAGTTYIKGSPSTATVTISNTGPQYFFVSASPTATTMSRAITNDYAEFIINRWGDLNGPGNTLGNVTPKTITLTNFTLKGTAIFPTDYTAGVQPFNPGFPPQDGSAAVSFPPGVASQTVLVGNPVSHANALQPTTNVTIIPTLTNAITGTNCTSQEGYAYFVNTASTTLTEFDNAQGLLAEVVLWSDPLTNSAAGNYTVTYAAGAQATQTVLPVYIPNYQYTNGGAPNGSGASLQAPSNYFDVQLGWPITNENNFETTSGTFPGNPYPNPPPSGVMAANGWSNVLRMTVDKQPGQNPTQCAVNLYPTTHQFYGNYALRFDMYLSVWSGALNNPGPAAYPRNFAAFGINTQGTNCDWRVSIPAGYPNANNPTNADGIWYCIDAADQSLTPADFDGFASPALPNNGTSDFVSTTAQSESGVFKRPPFPATDGAAAGTPINTWVNVSVETHASTNVSLVVDNTTIFANLAFTNNATSAPNNNLLAPAGNWTNGVPMLGYLQPYASQSDESAFVYYSNVRVVELSPTVINPPLSQLVLAGSTVNLTTAASYASQNLTNTWMRGTSTPAAGVATNTVASTNFAYGGLTNYWGGSDSLVLSNVTTGSNYWCVWSDQAGSVTSFVATVEVIGGPANVAANQGSKATFTVTASGPGAPTSYQWQTNGVNIANGTKYTNVTTASLGVSNCQPADAAVTYDCVVTRGNVTNLVGIYVIPNNI